MNSDYDIRKIRNIGIAAHIDAGKTTTTERILYYAGKIHRMGEVDDGTAQMDWMEQEKERGITITAAATSVFWNNHTINIIDTPGHVDFTIEVERSLRVLDGAIIVLCGVGGVEPQTETVWRQANKYNVPRLVFVNKMDRIGADFERAFEMLQKKLGANAWPINIPWGAENKLYGVIDIVELVGKHWLNDTLGAKYETLPIPPQIQQSVLEAREGLLERIAEFDEELLARYLNNEEIPIDLIKRAVRTGVIEHGFVPVMAGSAIRNIGIQPLLDATVDYLPAPIDIPPVKGTHPKTKQELVRKADFDAPMSALAFKIASDPFVERLTYLRIYSGHLKIGKVYLNPRTEKKERIQKIFRVHADKKQEINEAFAGDVVAVAGLRTVTTGDTLSDPDKPIIFEAMKFPEPVIYVAVEPRSTEDHNKMMKAIARLEDEDPTFKHREDPETGQILLSGMGELHLEIIVARMKREFNVSTNVGRPQVAYRETILKMARSTYTLDRTISGKHQYAEVTVQVEPVSDGKGVFEVQLDIPPDCQLPKVLSDAVVKGIMSSRESGPVAGYPLWNIYSRIIDVKFSEENYTDVAFEIASSQAFGQAIRNADPALLEPIMEIEVIIPDVNIGDVIGDLNARGAEIRGIDHRSDGDIVLAFVPLSEMFGYTTVLRSLTQGRGFFTMQFSHYRRLPKQKEEKILLKFRGY